ncbi:MAG: transcriptional repressor LexA [Gammaproteobacteria bacterium]|nr:transcriptional repressor LexA [Gammaproteobacteria bacterium]
MLTKSQHKILKFLERFFSNNGHAPTVAEIATGIGIKSRGVVYRNLQAIATKGLIRFIPGHRRNIELINSRLGYLPLVGRIAAGLPIEAIENVEWFNIAEQLAGDNRYLLQVKGDSMIEDSICDGDIVICEQAKAANNGQIVVALIDNQEATLKRIKYSSDSVTLIPANATLEPMIYARDRVQVQGVFVGLLRLTT